MDKSASKGAAVSGARWGGRRAQAYTRAVLATYGTVCHLCGHDGSDSADHLVPRSKGGAAYDLTNGRPAHHRPCPTCGRRCNGSRNDRPLPAAGVLVDGTPFVDLP